MTRTEQLEAIQQLMTDPHEAKVCPQCGTSIGDRRVIGRCLYLMPCGCRAGQVDEDGHLLASTFSLSPE